MARRLTIRKKLVAGFMLVLCISAVLYTNTLIGLYSYRNSVRAFDWKTRDLRLGSEFWESVSQIDHPSGLGLPGSMSLPGDDLDERLAGVERALEDYRALLNKSLRRGRDPDEGRAERELLDKIEHQLAALHKLPSYAYWEDDERWLLDLAMGGELLEHRRRFRHHVATLRELVKSLPDPTYEDMQSLADDARSSYRANLGIAWFSGALVLVLLIVLSRLTYYWIFRPIHQLHRSVLWVGQGNLSHRVYLRTGDEMQELAEAFNFMTARLQEICQSLERQVEERSRQLVRSEQLASVGFLAAGVAHEINNPLASISLGSETLERRLKRLLPPAGAEVEELWRCLAMIQSEAFRCKGITEKLLDFSRMRDHERQPCSLNGLVADVIDVVQHMGRYREKQIVLLGSSDVVAHVNPQELKQVTLNLVVNALDSMDAGGTLQIEVSEEAGQAVLVFADNGCGMTPELLQNIFEPFFTRSRTGRGTGLGLSITHRIIADHGGQIEAHSEGPQQGSRFTVRLPLENQGAKEDPRREPVAA